jgi:HAUS augmin-like complex subunit 1
MRYRSAIAHSIPRPFAQYFQVVINPDDARILDAVKANLTQDGQEALNALAATAVTLNTPTTNPETIAHALIQHTSTAQTLTNQVAHIHTLQTYLEKQHSLLRTQINELQTNPAFKTPPNLHRQTTEQTRQTKHLRSKIREYEDKLSSLQSMQSRTMTPGSKHIGSTDALMEMLEQQKALDELKARVESVEREVGEYSGLPADREAARKEVGKLEVRLDELRRKRDGLFEGMVGK